MPAAVLIGIGNPYRRDDGIGPALVTAIGQLGPPGVSLIISDGEPSQLLDAWSGATLAVVVDAVLCDPPAPGRIHRTVLDPASEQPFGGSLADAGAAAADAGGMSAGAASTHALGIPDAVRLAGALGRAPRRLVVFAVEAADIGFGPGLAPPVAACLPELIQVVLAELAAQQPG
jgi:hydrogenase maturation protease